MRDMQSAWMIILQASRRPSDHQAYSIKELKRLGQIKLQKNILPPRFDWHTWPWEWTLACELAHLIVGNTKPKVATSSSNNDQYIFSEQKFVQYI